MSRGGFRPNSGRPKGSKDKRPRTHRAPLPEVEAQKNFLAACASFINSGEPWRILRDFLDDPDPRMRAWAVEKLLAYGVGTPVARTVAPIEKQLSTMTLEQLYEREAQLDKELKALEPPEVAPEPVRPPKALITGLSSPSVEIPRAGRVPEAPPPDPIEAALQAELAEWEEAHRG